MRDLIQRPIFGGFSRALSGPRETELVLKMSSPVPMERREALAELAPSSWGDNGKLVQIATTDAFLSVRCDAAKIAAGRINKDFPNKKLSKVVPCQKTNRGLVARECEMGPVESDRVVLI